MAKAAAAVSILAACLALGKTKPQKEGEDLATFRTRVVKRVNKMLDEKKDSENGDKLWNSLNEAAQGWCNEVVKAAKAGEDIPAPPDEPQPEATAEKSGKKVKGKKVKGEKKAKKEKGPKVPRNSTITKIRDIMALDPSCTKDTLTAAVEKAGLVTSPSTLSTVFFHGHGMIEALKRAGKIK